MIKVISEMTIINMEIKNIKVLIKDDESSTLMEKQLAALAKLQIEEEVNKSIKKDISKDTIDILNKIGKT
jgi:hypothetical protein